MTKDTSLKLNMTFEESLGRFTFVSIKDITGIEEVSEPENNHSFSILLKGLYI